MKLALIMLAAGNSRRFGSNKLYYPVEGKPMYLHILERLLESAQKMNASGHACSVTVVTQYEAIRKRALEMGAGVLDNPHPEDGISSSVKIGLRAHGEADAWMFTVSDQPWLEGESICALLEGFLAGEQGIACLSRGGVPGNPCVFSRKYAGELLALSGDRGGKKIITMHPEDTLLVPVREERQLADVDVCPEKSHTPRESLWG